MREIAVLLTCAIAVGVTPATADVIFDNGDPNLFVGPWSDRDGSQIVADDFVLEAGATVISDIHWWGYYSGNNSPGADDFFILFFEDANGRPATTPWYAIDVGDSGRTDSTLNIAGIPDGSYDLYQYGIAITPITLSANTTYWISIINNTSDDANDNWSWAPSGIPGNSAWSALDGDLIWATNPMELAFYLTNDVVPEPATATLFGLGLAGLAIRLRKKG